MKKLTENDIPKERLEGVDLVGYWQDGQSYLFECEGTHILITKTFLEELLNDKD